MSDLKPKRQLTLVQTAAIIIGQVIGSGIFINVPIVAGIMQSVWGAVFVWFLGGLLWVPQILILAEMGTAYPNQGGPYYFIYKAGSPFLAFQYTWTAFLTSDTPTITIIGLLAADALTFFFPVLNIDIYAKVFAAIFILAFTALQYRSVKLGGNVQVVLTLLKLLPLFAVVIIGAFYLSDGNLGAPVLFGEEIKNSGKLSVLFAGIAATVWAYAGFLNILYTSGEIKSPESNLPKALIGSVLFVMVSYILISLCTSAIVQLDILTAVEEGKFINPFEHLEFFSNYAGGIFAIAVFISMLGVLNSSILTQPRLEWAMARDGLFFKSFGHLHPKYLTPDISIIAQSCLALVLLFLGGLGDLLGYFTISYLFQNTLVYGSMFFLKNKEDYKPVYKAPLPRTLAFLSILIQFVIIVGTFTAFPLGGLLASVGLIMSGVPVYYYFYLQKKKAISA